MNASLPRALVVALGYGWAFHSAQLLLGYAASLFLALIGAYDPEFHRNDVHYRELAGWSARYVLEVAILGIAINGTTLLGSIMFVRRANGARAFLEVCVWVQLAMMAFFTAMNVGYIVGFAEPRPWILGGIGRYTTLFSFFGGASAVYQSYAWTLVSILSLIGLRHLKRFPG